ncbi:MAG: ribosome silencing factor [Gammaproteobacteria bacterium]
MAQLACHWWQILVTYQILIIAVDQWRNALSENKPTAQRIASSRTNVSRDALIHELVLTSLDDDLAQDIVSINLTGKSAIADYMVIATGRSQRHVKAIAEHLIKKLKHEECKNIRMEGQSNCDWVLVDAGDVVAHIFRAEMREFYGLEKMWASEAQNNEAQNNKAHTRNPESNFNNLTA